jgi:ApaG protein
MADQSSKRRSGGAHVRPADQPNAGPEDYVSTTRGVCVTVRSYFLADQSQPEDGHFVWAYRVRIENQGRLPVQLLRRTWRITDAHGRTQHVHGAGVVGEQPLLEPGESFEYTSGTPLDTPSGFMVGAYHMVVPSSGEAFDVAIPAFSLDSPHQPGQVH